MAGINVPVDRTAQVGGIPTPKVADIAPNQVPDAGGAASQQIASGFESAAGSVRDFAAKQQQNANEMALTSLDLEASHEQTRIENAARQMRGQDAMKAPDFVNEQWSAVQQRLKEKAANQSQAMALQRLLAQRSESLDKLVNTHVADETYKFDSAQTDAAISAYSDEAVHNYRDPDRIADAKAKQDAQVDMIAGRQGWSALQVQQKKLEVASNTNTAIMMRMLDNGDYKSAQAYYDKIKDDPNQLDQKGVLVAEKQLEEGKMRSIGMDAWNSVQGLKLADGNPDEAAQEKAIMSRADLTDSEKEKVVAYVKQRANTAKVDKAMQDRANDRAFLNAAMQARQQGLPYDSVLPMTRKFGSDTYDQQVKTQQLQEIYAPSEVKTDPATKVALFDGIDAGTVDKAAIQKAYDSKQISGNDYVQAMEKYRSNVIDGKNPQQARLNEQLKLMAKTQYGSDTATANAWLSEMKSQGFGKPPEEQLKIATDSIEKDKNSTSRFWNWLPVVGGDPIPGTGKPQFETDIKKRTNDSLVKGQYQQDLGPEAVKAIDVSNQVTGRGESSAKTITDMAAAFGGYDKIRPGTPVYNAWQGLMKAGKVVTTDSIKAVLQHYPDGNFTVDNTPPTVSRIGRVPRVRK